MRRFTRLTNAFSKKLENHGHMVALYFMHYNFCRVHKTLRVPPAMEAGIANHIWTLEELLELLNDKAALSWTAFSNSVPWVHAMLSHGIGGPKAYGC